MRRWLVLVASSAGLIPRPVQALPRELTGTWSPDRQVAIAQEKTRLGITRCFFRDQRTGADLGEVPAPGQLAKDSRPMTASWNFPGDRVMLLIERQPERYEVCGFERGADGRFRRLGLALPDPLAMFRRPGKTPPYPAGDLYSEIGFGPWEDDHTFPLAVGKVITVPPANRYALYTFYCAQCKVRFQANHAGVTDVRFKGALDYSSLLNYDVAWGYSDLSYFTISTVHTLEPDRIAVGHGRISEQVGSTTDFVWQDGIDKYHQDFHRYPEGDNRSIARQLLGLNPKRKIYSSLSYAPLDGNGVAVDLWNEPYVFDFHGGKARVYSSRFDMDSADQQKGRLWPDLYDPLYCPGRAYRARAYRYKLALAVRLLVQRCGRVPPLPETLHMLFDFHQKDWPILYVGDGKIPAGILDDPWGSRYVVKLTPTQVSVSSVHLPGEASIEPLGMSEP